MSGRALLGQGPMFPGDHAPLQRLDNRDLVRGIRTVEAELVTERQ